MTTSADAVAKVLTLCDERFCESVYAYANMLAEHGTTTSELAAGLLRYGATYVEWRDGALRRVEVALRNAATTTERDQRRSLRTE